MRRCCILTCRRKDERAPAWLFGRREGASWPLHHYTPTPCNLTALVCGQCHDKLSILSVTVARSPSGTVKWGEAGPILVLHQTRAWRQRFSEGAPWKEKRRIWWNTARKNQCLPWFHFMNGQGRLLGSNSRAKTDLNSWLLSYVSKEKTRIDGFQIICQKKCQYIFKSISFTLILYAYMSKPVTFLKMKSTWRRLEEAGDHFLYVHHGPPHRINVQIFQTPLGVTDFPL